MSKAYIPLRIEKYQLKDEEVLEVLCIGEKMKEKVNLEAFSYTEMMALEKPPVEIISDEKKILNRLLSSGHWYAYGSEEIADGKLLITVFHYYNKSGTGTHATAPTILVRV
jgi:hypothetical protein